MFVLLPWNSLLSALAFDDLARCLGDRHAGGSSDGRRRRSGGDDRGALVTGRRDSVRIAAAAAAPRPLARHVRARDGVSIDKGKEALILEHDPEKRTYVVVPFALGE